MTDDEYLEALNELFSTSGWSALMIDLEETQERLNDLTKVDTIESLHYSKGQLNMINHFLTLEHQIKLAGELWNNLMITNAPLAIQQLNT